MTFHLPCLDRSRQGNAPAECTGPPLTPVAMTEGSIVADNLVHGKKVTRPDYTFVPSAVFTLPILASVGYTQKDAQAEGLEFSVRYKEPAGWFHNSRVNEKFAGHKVLVEKDTNKILGAHVIGQHADDIINAFAIAMQNNLTTDDLKNVIYAYPTATSSIRYML